MHAILNIPVFVGDTPEIENLRPKSPKAKNKEDGGKVVGDWDRVV